MAGVSLPNSSPTSYGLCHATWYIYGPAQAIPQELTWETEDKDGEREQAEARSHSHGIVPAEFLFNKKKNQE